MKKLFWKKTDALMSVKTIDGVPYLSSTECDKLSDWDDESEKHHPFGEVQCFRFVGSDDVIGWYDDEQ